MRTILLLLFAAISYGATVDTPDLGTGASPIPSSLPPSGAAGGDLSGTYPNPTVAAARFAAPGPIGSVTPSTGAFTALSATGRTTVPLALTRSTFSNAAVAIADAGCYVAQVGSMSASRVATLPTAANAGAGGIVVVADESGSVTSTNTIVVTAAGADTINGVTTMTISGAYGRIFLASDGTSKWTVIGAQVFANSTSIGSTQVGYGDAGGKITSDSAFTRASLALGVDPTTDNTFTTGYGKMGLAVGGVSTVFSIAQASNYTSTNYALKQLSVGATRLNSATGQNIEMRVNDVAVAAFAAAGSSVVGTDSGTTNVLNSLILAHTTSGTAAAGFGSGLLLNGYDDGGTSRQQARIYGSWTDAASATRTSKFAIEILNSAAVVTPISITPALITQVSTDAATASATIVHNFTHATSGTAANGFGTTLQISGADDGGTQRAMGQISSTWTTAASGTRSSNLKFNVINSTTNTTALTLAPTSATFAAGFPLTISDTTEASAVGTASAVIVGGLGVAKRSYLGTIGSTFKGNVNAGVQDATAAAAGQVGEVISSSVTSYTNYTTTGTIQQLATITLTAGDWMEYATVTYYGNSATNATDGEFVSYLCDTTASATGAVEGETLVYQDQPVTGTLHRTVTISFHENTSASKSKFLNGKAAFSVGNPQFVCSLKAVRIR